MTDTNPVRVCNLITELHKRTKRRFEDVRERMTAYLGIFEYDRSQFDNKFRRKKRRSNYQLDEILAIITAFTFDLSDEVRCTPYEAIQLFRFTGMSLDDYGRLKEIFDEEEYMEAWDQHLRDLALRPESAIEQPALNQPVDRFHRNDTATGGRTIFISYSNHDARIAKKLRDILRAAGHRVWQDVTHIPSGSTWIDEIKSGINDSCAVVLIVSASSLKSYWVREEILHVQFYSIPVIPFVIDNSPLPFGLRQIKEINAYPNFEAGIDNLLKTLSPCLANLADQPYPRRQLELEYLDDILSNYKEWDSRYIALAGMIEILPPGPNVPETTSIPGKMIADFDRFIIEALGDTRDRAFPDDILPVIDQMKQLLILGEAGSGKSTSLQKIAIELANKAQLSESEPLPVLVQLSTLEDDQSLEAKIKEQLGALSIWYDELLSDRRLALLVDGLNELSRKNQDLLIEEIRVFTRIMVATNQIMLLTCRTLDYNHTLDTGISRRLFIKPLDPIRIRQYIDVNVPTSLPKRDELFWILAGSEAKRFWDRFVTEVRDDLETFWLSEQLPDNLTWGYGGSATQYFYWNQWIEIRKRPNTLLQLARNPYMLFMIARVFTTYGRIPQNRAQLFQTFVDYVLKHREGLSVTRAEELTKRLAGLAFAMQSSTDPSSTTFQTALLYLGDESAFHVARSANILESGETVRFTHQLLQEYFAAHKLESEIKNGLAASQLWPPESWWLPGKWDEVVILLAGLHPSDTSPTITWLEDTAPEIAARCVTESGGVTPAARQSSLAEKWVVRLSEMPIAARASIGRALGILGNDPRPGVGLTSEGLPDLDWVEIPEGEFVYGNNEKCHLKAFAMTRYLITWCQFQSFINDAEGFYNDRWWSELARREEAPGFQSFRYTNHPCERVSWYDAVAFCRWFSDKLGYEVKLPTEYQWEKAARGSAGYQYPYGNMFDAQRGNIDLTGIGKTSAVGLFPEGASPYGLLDMSGNVFEWCLDTVTTPDQTNQPGEDRRSLRGGSWAHSKEHGRADYRYSNRPEMRRNRIGFRIIRER